MRVIMTAVNLCGNTSVDLRQADRYSYDEAMKKLDEEGSLTGAVFINLWSFRGHPDPEYALINELINVGERGIQGLYIDKYRIFTDAEDERYPHFIFEITLKKHISP